MTAAAMPTAAAASPADRLVALADEIAQIEAHRDRLFDQHTEFGRELDSAREALGVAVAAGSDEEALGDIHAQIRALSEMRDGAERGGVIIREKLQVKQRAHRTLELEIAEDLYRERRTVQHEAYGQLKATLRAFVDGPLQAALEALHDAHAKTLAAWENAERLRPPTPSHTVLLNQPSPYGSPLPKGLLETIDTLKSEGWESAESRIAATARLIQEGSRDVARIVAMGREEDRKAALKKAANPRDEVNGALDEMIDRARASEAK